MPIPQLIALRAAQASSDFSEVVTVNRLPRTIVGQLVDTMIHRRFVRKDADLPRLNIGAISPCVEVCQKVVEPATQCAVAMGASAKVPDELHGRNGRDRNPRQLAQQGHLSTEGGDCSARQQHVQKSQAAMGARGLHLTDVMINGRAKELEPHQVHGLGGVIPGGCPFVPSPGGDVGRGGGGAGLVAQFLSPMRNVSPSVSRGCGGSRPSTVRPAPYAITDVALRKLKGHGPMLALRAAQAALFVVILVNAPTTAALIIQAGGNALRTAVGG